MAIRIRKDGRLLCAAMHKKEEGDIYLSDEIVEKLPIVPGPEERHRITGEWWWAKNVPPKSECYEFDGFIYNPSGADCGGDAYRLPEAPREEGVDDGCVCTVCGRTYPGDFIVSDDVWRDINPSGKLLCGCCIVLKLEETLGFCAFKLNQIKGKEI